MLGTRKKLMAAVVMLVISAILMTSASYAWFTISTNPEISGMTTQVVTNENLEIALASTGGAEPAATAVNQSGNQYTWGNIVNLSSTGGTAYTAYNSLNKTLRPATLGSSGFSYPIYGSDGRISGNLQSLTVGAMSNGFGTLTGADGKVYGYYIDFWLRTNIAGGGMVTLSTATNRSTGSDGVMGGGTVLTSADADLLRSVRIAFQPGATGTITPATAGSISSSGDYSIPFTGNVVTLQEYVAQLVRMYVYYEGAALLNSDALLGDSLVNGSLNVQFAITNVNTSMDGYN